MMRVVHRSDCRGFMSKIARTCLALARPPVPSAQLGWPDMRLPILYSMSWPHRVAVDYGRGIDEKFDLIKLGSMSFKV